MSKPFRRHANTAARNSPLKSRPLRNPGQSLDEQIELIVFDDFLAWAIAPLLLWFLATVEWLAAIRDIPRMPLVYVLLATCATGLVVWRFFDVRKRVRSMRLGRDGERAIGQYLERLRVDGAQVFHDVIADDFNLDHVVIAPQGIFLIETKTWTKRHPNSKISTRNGQLLKDGLLLDPNPLLQATFEAAWLARTLEESTGRKFDVWPVVLFPGWFVEPMDEATKQQGWVLSGREFPSFLQRESARLANEDVHLCAFHLSRYIRTKFP